MNEVLRVRRMLPVPARTAYHWHSMRGAFERLAPPWQETRLLVAPDALAEGTQAVIEVRAAMRRRQWVAEHFDVHEGHSFSDRQLIGPFAAWEHHHRFICSEDEDTSVLEDEIHYRLPGGALGRALAGRWVRRSLERVFAYRHALCAADAARYWRRGFPRQGIILVTGHTGLIGHSLTALLRSLGYEVRGLTRHPRGPGDFHWDPAKGEIDAAALGGVQAVVHLAGAGIAEKRWTARRKRLLLESRRASTDLIARTIAAQTVRPRVLVSASGANAYPLDGQSWDETGPPGDGFLAEICRVWEAAADPARAAGVRVVHPRFGAVLTPGGGVLAKLLPAFRAGLGGPVGTGRQMFSWIGLDDAVDVLVQALTDDRLVGPVNAVAPEVVSQREFAAALGQVLGRPAVFPVPAAAVRALVGREMADETVLANLHVVPGRLQQVGYVWRHAHLPDALRHYLGRESVAS